MEATDHFSADTPLSVILEKVQKTGQRIVLTTGTGEPIADVVPHVETISGAGLLDNDVPEDTSVSLEDMQRGIVEGAKRGFNL